MKDNPYRKAEDLGPSGFDPHAPYKPVDPDFVSKDISHIDSQEKNLAILAHLLGCISIVYGSVPGFIGPLVIWIWQKDKSPYVERQAKEALNFQITLLLLSVAFAVLGFITCGAFFPLLLLLPVFQIVFGIIATMSVSNGNAYRYPFNFRLIK